MRPAIAAPRSGYNSGQRRFEMARMKLVKLLCGVGFLLVLASNIWTISRWNESRGVYDDICYLRQAHLFQRFGLDGLNTDIKRDDDHYLVDKLKAIGFPEWNDPASSLPSVEAGDRQIRHAISAGNGLCAGAVSRGLSGDPALCARRTSSIFGFALLGIYLGATISTSLTLAAVFGLPRSI